MSDQRHVRNQNLDPSGGIIAEHSREMKIIVYTSEIVVRDGSER
jgi:hypothetical protein